MPDNCPSGVELTSRLDFRVLTVIVLTIGIFLRFLHLDFQDYWHDEAITSLHIAGHTKTDGQVFLLEQPRKFAELVKYCEPLKNDFARVWQCWSWDQPEKAPLFYTLEYYWACAFGNQIITMRLLPAILGLLQLPAYFWFGIELFGSRTAAWLMTALVAISPTAILWAQEAREYSLYAAMIAFSCAAFLHVMKTPSRRNWLLYGCIMAISLYSSFLMTFVIAAQLSFLVLKRRYDQLASFAMCSLATLLLLIPWIQVNIPHMMPGYKSLYWMGKYTDRGLWLSGVFCNLWIPLFYPIPGGFVSVDSNLEMALGLGACFYSLYRIFQLRSYSGPYFLLLLLVISSIPFVATDLLLEGKRAVIPKYMMHMHVFLIAGIAFSFALHSDWKGHWYRKLLWWVVLISFCLLSINSTVAMLNSHTSFLKQLTYGQLLRPMAAALNQHSPAGNPATIIMEVSPTNQTQMFALCRIVKPEINVIMVEKLTLDSIPAKHGALYVLNPQPVFIQLLQRSGYVLTPLFECNECYSLERN